MELSTEFWDMADEFMHHIHEQTGFPVIICNDQAVITKANAKERIGIVHEGVKRILSGEIDELAITKEDAEADPHYREGLNCPITLNCERVATFGIAGPLKLAVPLVHIASMVLSARLKELNQQHILTNTTHDVRTKTDTLKDQIDEVVFRSQDLQTKMLEETDNVANNMDSTQAILDKIKRITSQSKILSINASIEAARAGEAGRAFTIVAKQITELAEDTRKSETEIRMVLDIIREAIGNLGAAIKDFSEVTSDNADVMNHSFKMINTLQDSIANLQLVYRKCDVGT